MGLLALMLWGRDWPLGQRLLMILGIAIAAHLFVRVATWLSRSLLGRRRFQNDKARTLIQFSLSVLILAVYFVALGVALLELGVPVGTYIASATVIGLAFSFGSQLMVQDVISGLTLIFADLLDVGDMVDIGGQVGIVEHIGVRYTRLTNFTGALINVPNRNVANVVRYPDGFTRAYLDIQVPVVDGVLAPEYPAAIESVCAAAAAQFPGVILLPPDVVRSDPAAGGEDADVMRAKFRIWPGQSAIIGGAVRQAVLSRLREIDPGYPDWKITLVERAEMDGGRSTLPVPNAVSRRRGGGRSKRSGNG
ncbi:MAG: mechanosensitive ion channel domain-containing protein [Planctomycetota bacterium]